MIRSFRHRGLERFFQSGSKAGIQPAHERRLRLLLTALDAAKDAAEMDAPGWELHQLQGKFASHWAVKVNANWRLTFRFLGEDVELVDYLDYH